jgi:hypothetical protein
MKPVNSTPIGITLRPVDLHGRFSAHLDQIQLVTASRQPFCDAARILHELGYRDDCIIAARHHGAAHASMSGLIGKVRKLRVREDRNGPRFVEWQPFGSRRVECRSGDVAAGTQPAPTTKNQRPADRGATKRLPASRLEIPATAPSWTVSFRRNEKYTKGYGKY